MAIPVLKACAITGRDITADALHTQRGLAAFLVKEGAHYHFTAKGNQPKLEQDIALLFAGRPAADFSETDIGHGRIETRRIWCSTQLNGYLDFPHVAQVFLIEREVVQKKTGKTSCEIALGLTSRPPNEASPERLLAINRGHWQIEAMHYLLDWNFDEDRCRIRTGFGPENITRLRRFAIGVLKSFQKPGQSIASMMRKLCLRSRIVLDYLRLTNNAAPARQPA
jgi:predicted transposase YbfD/YdcC